MRFEISRESISMLETDGRRSSKLPGRDGENKNDRHGESDISIKGGKAADGGAVIKERVE